MTTLCVLACIIGILVWLLCERDGTGEECGNFGTSE